MLRTTNQTLKKKKGKKKHNHIPIISGTPFFSTTRRASSSTLLFDLCKNHIKTLIIISINHPQKLKTIQPTHIATPISDPITFLNASLNSQYCYVNTNHIIQLNYYRFCSILIDKKINFPCSVVNSKIEMKRQL